MVRVVDCHTGVLGSNPGGPKRFSPWNYFKHIQMIENIQRRGTKLVQELVNINYTDRLKMLNLPTLKYRRKRGDLIQVFKIFNGLYDINWEDFFTLDINRTHNTRGHSKK